MEHNSVRTIYAVNEVEYATGEQFERYAQYLLTLMHATYIGTRIHKDKGIDGLILERGSKRAPTIFYAIYGPEKTTVWAKRLSKLKSDVMKIMEYAKDKDMDYSITFILNYRMANADEVFGLKAFMDGHQIPFSVFDPNRIFSSISGGSNLQNAVAFIHGIEQEEAELTDFNNHVFAGKVLDKLQAFKRHDDIKDKMDYILRMRSQLLSYITVHDFRLMGGKDAHNLYIMPKYDVLMKQTKVNWGCRTAYLLDDSQATKVRRIDEETFTKMFEQSFDEGSSIIRVGEKGFAVKIENLGVMFTILNKCYIELELYGDGDFSLYTIISSIVEGRERTNKLRNSRPKIELNMEKTSH